MDELRGEEGAEESGRGLPLLGGEVGVAGGHREAVALAHRRGDEDLHREAEVGDEPHHDGALLRVFLAEDGHVGEDEAEEPGDDGGDAVEVPGAARPLHPLGDARDVDRRREAGRVHHVDGRGEEEVGAGLAELLGVGLKVARVALEVFPRAELLRVDEDRDDDLPGGAARLLDEREVPRVEGAHRRDEGDALPLLAVRGDGGAEVGNGCDPLHRLPSPAA